MIGVDIGTYRQVSDSYHAYLDNPQWEALKDSVPYDIYPYPYYQMIQNRDTFNLELNCFVKGLYLKDWTNSFFPEVAIPMKQAWHRHKADKTGWVAARNIKDVAWRDACLLWLARREDYERC
jgi:hypothetical protein